MISLFCRATWSFVLLLSFGVKGLISESFWGLLLGVWGLWKARQSWSFRLPRSKRGISNFKEIYLMYLRVRCRNSRQANEWYCQGSLGDFLFLRKANVI